MRAFSESEVEEAALDWFGELGFTILAGPDIAPGEPAAERDDFSQVILPSRLMGAIRSLNPSLPASALEDAFRKVSRPEAPTAVANNRAFHKMLVDGVAVEYKHSDGSIRGDSARLIDFDNPDKNDWVAVNQFAVIENHQNRRPDIVVFVNGLPFGVIELKNAADEDATIYSAFNQLQTYKLQIPSLFAYNEALIISDGLTARVGSLTAPSERFMPWRTVEGATEAHPSISELGVLLRGMFDKTRFLKLLRHCIVFEDDGHGNVRKLMAGYHQFFAVEAGIEATVRATGPSGDRKVGVVWHTQGSGKSLTMVFYAGRAILHPALENPTIVVITDRNDLDDQLFTTFSRCHELLRQIPVQAADRADLRSKLRVASGGVIFTTIQKFFPGKEGDKYPQLTDRRNVIVIADEAHRSQYDTIDGFARHMRDALPNAAFIAFTATPIELSDANTRSMFGNDISVYDIEQSVKDKATVTIYYESRLARLALDEGEKPKLDPGFEEITEGEEVQTREKLKTKWAALEAVVGADKRVRLIAQDIVDHFERRLVSLDGKAMVVCMSRRICVALYAAIVELRPQWHDPDPTRGVIKVVMTGSASDPIGYQPHLLNKPQREMVANRFKDPADPMKVVIVRDMWLTGFDAPSLHTMYLDKPMHDHGLMQAIARVNRVFKDKPGGLIVDYLGLAQNLREAMAIYTQSGGKGRTSIDISEAVAVLLEKYEVCRDLFHGYDWSKWTAVNGQQRLSMLKEASQFILEMEGGKDRLMKAVADVSAAFALAGAHEAAIRIRDDIGFFQAVRAAVAKATMTGSGKSPDELDSAIQQLVSKAILPGGVIDIFEAAGLRKPDVSILSDEFMAEVRALPQKNLAVELLRKLLADEIKSRSRRNVVQARSFLDLLEKSMRRYQSRAIETAQVIEELIGLAKDLKAAAKRGDDLGLTDDELAFYDALETNDSAVKVLGDDTLKTIARELVQTVRSNVSIDWAVRESARARLRVMVRRILSRHGYPPDKRLQATITVLEQAEVLSGAWAA